MNHWSEREMSFKNWKSSICDTKNNIMVEDFIEKHSELFLKNIQKMKNSNKFESKEIKMKISKQRFKDEISEMVYKFS